MKDENFGQLIKDDDAQASVDELNEPNSDIAGDSPPDADLIDEPAKVTLPQLNIAMVAARFTEQLDSDGTVGSLASSLRAMLDDMGYEGYTLDLYDLKPLRYLICVVSVSSNDSVYLTSVMGDTVITSIEFSTCLSGGAGQYWTLLNSAEFLIAYSGVLNLG